MTGQPTQTALVTALTTGVLETGEMVHAGSGKIPTVETPNSEGYNEIKTQNRKEKSKDSSITRPSNPYDITAKPKGSAAKITGRLDEETTRSLKRENEATQILAQYGYNVEQNPKVEGTTRRPDYVIEGNIFDCYAPAKNTSVRSIGRTISEKVTEKKQADRIILNLDDWVGDINALKKQLKEYSIVGLKEVLAVRNGKVISLYP